jgi:hypothetical protein
MARPLQGHVLIYVRLISAAIFWPMNAFWGRPVGEAHQISPTKSANFVGRLGQKRSEAKKKK